MIINKTATQFNDVPETLNGEVLLERNQGFHTCTQEDCFEIMTAGVQVDVWPASYDVSGVDINQLNKPSKASVISTGLNVVAEALKGKTLPQAIQNRVNGLGAAMNVANLDSAIGLKWKLILDIRNG